MDSSPFFLATPSKMLCCGGLKQIGKYTMKKIKIFFHIWYSGKIFSKINYSYLKTVLLERQSPHGECTAVQTAHVGKCGPTQSISSNSTSSLNLELTVRLLASLVSQLHDYKNSRQSQHLCQDALNCP